MLWLVCFPPRSRRGRGWKTNQPQHACFFCKSLGFFLPAGFQLGLRAPKQNLGFHKVLIAGVFFQKSPGHLLKNQPRTFTGFFLTSLIFTVFPCFFLPKAPNDINFFSSKSLVFSFFVCLFVKLDTFTEKAQSIYSQSFLFFQIRIER